MYLTVPDFLQMTLGGRKDFLEADKGSVGVHTILSRVTDGCKDVFINFFQFKCNHEHITKL